MIDEQEAFEKKLAAEQAAGFKARMEDEPPIGTGPDGAFSKARFLLSTGESAV